MKKCEKCGYKHENDNVQFCDNCGYNLSKETLHNSSLESNQLNVPATRIFRPRISDLIIAFIFLSIWLHDLFLSP